VLYEAVTLPMILKDSKKLQKNLRYNICIFRMADTGLEMSMEGDHRTSLSISNMRIRACSLSQS